MVQLFKSSRKCLAVLLQCVFHLSFKAWSNNCPYLRCELAEVMSFLLLRLSCCTSSSNGFVSLIFSGKVTVLRDLYTHVDTNTVCVYPQFISF